jgi:hypothetical protein
MNKEQADKVIKAAFAIDGGRTAPDSFDAESVAKRLAPFDYVAAQQWIDYQIDNGGNPRDFGRMIESLRRETDSIPIDTWEETRRTSAEQLKQQDQCWQATFGSAADLVRMFADEKIRKYRYRTFRYAHLAPSINWHDDIMHMMRPTVGSADLKVIHNAQNYVLEVLEITGVWRDRVLELAKKPYGDRTKTIGRKLNDDGEPSGMPEKVYSLIANLSAQLKA